MKRIGLFLLLVCVSLLTPIILLAQDKAVPTPFDIQAFIISLVVNGGAGMLVSGWIAAKWTGASGIAMIIQTLIVSLLLTAAASLVGIIPVPITDYWLFLRTSATNGVLAMMLYKFGIFDGILEKLGAKSVHQLVPDKV